MTLFKPFWFDLIVCSSQKVSWQYFLQNVLLKPLQELKIASYLFKSNNLNTMSFDDLTLNHANLNKDTGSGNHWLPDNIFFKIKPLFTVTKQKLKCDFYKPNTQKSNGGKSTHNDIFSNLMILSHFCVVRARADKWFLNAWSWQVQAKQHRQNRGQPTCLFTRYCF